MNAPQHSFPHIPFNFNSLIELATLCCTHPHHAEGKKLSLQHTRARAGDLYPTAHPEKIPFPYSLKPEKHSHIHDREFCPWVVLLAGISPWQISPPRLCGCIYEKVYISQRLTLLSAHTFVKACAVRPLRWLVLVPSIIRRCAHVSVDKRARQGHR